jgi:Rrf2 family protein
LTKAGFVRSSVGVSGGIQLAVNPAEISLLEVFEVVEGRMYLNKCLISPSVCHRSVHCPVHVIWYDIQQQVKDQLGKKSLADLASLNAENLAKLAPTSAL